MAGRGYGSRQANITSRIEWKLRTLAFSVGAKEPPGR